MLIEQIVKKQNRNYDVEKESLLGFSKFLNPYISIEDIQKRLEGNGFKGVYMTDEFDSIEGKSNVLGIYSSSDKAIVLKKEGYYKDKTVGIHEMGHAFLNGRNRKSIVFDNMVVDYGSGLEEGAMSFLQYSSSIKNINEIDSKVYPLQCNLFKQLNILYSYSKSKKYENLLIHLFMEPETFIPLISNIYEDIYLNKLSSFNVDLATKSAFAIVSATDALIEYNDIELYKVLCYVNSLYINIANNKSKEEENKLFINSKDFEKTKEEEIFYALFNSDIGYMKRLELYLNIALHNIIERLEQFDYKKLNDEKCKILLPR